MFRIAANCPNVVSLAFTDGLTGVFSVESFASFEEVVGVVPNCLLDAAEDGLVTFGRGVFHEYLLKVGRTVGSHAKVKHAGRLTVRRRPSACP